MAFGFKWSGSLFITSIFIVDHISVRPKKYFAKNLELGEPKKLVIKYCFNCHETAVKSAKL